MLAGTVLPFLLILYLALRGGGYDAVVRSEVGVAIWWIVVLGAIVGVLPIDERAATPLDRARWTLRLCCMDRDRSHLVRIAGAHRRRIWPGWPPTRGVCPRAQRVRPRCGSPNGLFGRRRPRGDRGACPALAPASAPGSPRTKRGKALEIAVARLNFPVDYWNALAALMAIGTPLLLAIAVNSRRIATQALATASVPVMALVAFYTLSRGGAIEIESAWWRSSCCLRNDFKSCQASRSQGWEARC